MLKLKERKIRELIGNTGLSVRAWGIEHGFPQGTLSNWVNGSRNISKQQLVKLANALGIDVLSEISYVEFHLDKTKNQEIENETEEISHLWRYLSKEQRQNFLMLIRTIAEPNMVNLNENGDKNER